MFYSVSSHQVLVFLENQWLVCCSQALIVCGHWTCDMRCLPHELLPPYVIDGGRVQVDGLGVILYCTTSMSLLPLRCSQRSLLLQNELSSVRVEVDWLLNSQVWTDIVVWCCVSSLWDAWATFWRLLASYARPFRVVPPPLEDWLELGWLLLDWLRGSNEELLRTEVLNKETRSSWFGCLRLGLYGYQVRWMAKLNPIRRFH